MQWSLQEYTKKQNEAFRENSGYTEYEEGCKVLEDKLKKSHEIYREEMIARGYWKEDTPSVEDMFKEDETDEVDSENKDKNIL